MSDIHIRAERPDHPQVVALLSALDAYLATLYPPEANHILDIEALRARGVTFLVAWQGPTALGCGATRRMPGEPASQGRAYVEVKRMYVQPEARSQRIGVRLLEALEDAARGRGVELAMLETGVDQHEAIRLYERTGYRRCEAFGGYPDNGLSAFYSKDLRP
jgi:putative acetyltransferase